MQSPESILSSIRAKLDHPATMPELMKRLRVSRDQQASFRRRLETLVESGALIKIRGNRYGLPDLMRLVTGRVQVNPRGFGFVTPDREIEGFTGDLYIAGSNLNQAMHGDRVVARVERDRDPDRVEGRIVRIIERATEKLVGRYEIDESGLGFVVPFDRRLIMDVHVPRGANGKAKQGEMVAVQLTRWPTTSRNAIGRVTEVLGDINEPGVDTRLIICKYGLPCAHDSEAVSEARRLGSAIRSEDLRGRSDFRPLTTVTIDGETARDFDDAITIERRPNGAYWLGVHIADVAHYVPEGGALDTAAYLRGTSVYFPERAVHMFPDELATGLCSLNPHVDRLVQSCFMEIDAQGEVVQYETHDGVIHSNARMTYAEVNAILTGVDSELREQHEYLVPQFELMQELFSVLFERRKRRGSIDFDLPEAEFRVDDEGLVEAIVATERTVANRMIEEFMLVANETVASHLEEQMLPTLYRVHEAPDPLKIAEFEEFVCALGYSLAATPESVKPLHFQRLLERLQGKREVRPIVFLMLRTMQQARYDPLSLGHFGLAAAAYTHFTSPIRRYPDLLVHRALRESRAVKPDMERRGNWLEKLPVVARHTSERERRAEDAERELVQWKKVRFMADKVGDEFTGYVIGVTAFGLFVELVEHFVEGLIHISTMVDDYYRFDERQHLLNGENTGKRYRLGDFVRVQLVRVDGEQRRISLALIEILETVRSAEGRRSGSRSKTREKRKRPERRGEKRSPQSRRGRR
jgi:ribonuclease R